MQKVLLSIILALVMALALVGMKQSMGSNVAPQGSVLMASGGMTPPDVTRSGGMTPPDVTRSATVR